MDKKPGLKYKYGGTASWSNPVKEVKVIHSLLDFDHLQDAQQDTEYFGCVETLLVRLLKLYPFIYTPENITIIFFFPSFIEQLLCARLCSKCFECLSRLNWVLGCPFAVQSLLDS